MAQKKKVKKPVKKVVKKTKKKCAPKMAAQPAINTPVESTPGYFGSKQVVSTGSPPEAPPAPAAPALYGEWQGYADWISKLSEFQLRAVVCAEAARMGHDVGYEDVYASKDSVLSLAVSAAKERHDSGDAITEEDMAMDVFEYYKEAFETWAGQIAVASMDAMNEWAKTGGLPEQAPQAEEVPSAGTPAPPPPADASLYFRGAPGGPALMATLGDLAEVIREVATGARVFLPNKPDGFTGGFTSAYSVTAALAEQVAMLLTRTARRGEEQ